MAETNVKVAEQGRLRLSYSSLELFNTCERKFQLEKLLENPMTREESEHLSFGKAFGAGIGTYLSTGNKDLAIFHCWLNYYPLVENSKGSKKTRWMAVHALNCSFRALDTLLEKYEVAEFKGAPAIELSFKLNINETKYFVGHIDVVLRNRTTGKFYILEVKTTGLQLLDLKPLYQNSGQALGYSIALDSIVGEELNEYGVLYFVAQLPASNAQDNLVKVHTLPFNKTIVDRLGWFVTLGTDVQRMETLENLNIFPKRGHSCLKYNRPCNYFGNCNMQNFDVKKDFTKVIDDIDYQFEFDLEELIDTHLSRIANMPATKFAGEDESPGKIESSNGTGLIIDLDKRIEQK